jgi:hypothetical protein
VVPESLRAFPLAAGALLLACVAPADDWTNTYTGTTWNNPISSFLDTTIWSRSFQLPSGAATAAKPPPVTYKPGPSLVPEALAEQVG